ncbi:MAG: N-acylglucosamine 2-epimerase [Planctomycetes bacterium]|nr:N-acylglucosamine 2-epimerase [Planctomycetota bacterium]
MPAQRIDELRKTYEGALLENVLPFWIRHSPDHEHGGFFSSLDRDGRVLDPDKAMWVQGRFSWLLATLCLEMGAEENWRRLALHGITFLREHGFDQDGRMWFHVTQDGRPLRKRRYVFTECFAAMAFAAWARLAGDADAERTANTLLDLVVHHLRAPVPAKTEATRPMKSLGAPMILLNLAQVFRQTIEHADADALADAAIAEIRDHFVKPELGVVMENVAPDGRVVDATFDGRLLNPGHAIEAAWFILEEARVRGGDAGLIALGTSMLDMTWKRGWDPVEGGLLYFCALDGGPVAEYWHDMKFWWPHCEAIIATLFAYELTGRDAYLDLHRQVHDWTFKHFPDPVHGEWYGYLHRDGRISVPLKGNLWKGPFHIPRMLLLCRQACLRMTGRTGSG